MKRRFIFSLALVLIGLMFAGTANAQTPTPTSTPNPAIAQINLDSGQQATVEYTFTFGEVSTTLATTAVGLLLAAQFVYNIMYQLYFGSRIVARLDDLERLTRYGMDQWKQIAERFETE